MKFQSNSLLARLTPLELEAWFGVKEPQMKIESLQQFLAQFTPAELATCPPELLPTFGQYGLTFPDMAEGSCSENDCPVAQCHPLCYQVVGHGEDIYCHCPCHG